MFDEENMHYLDIPELGSKLECFANGDSVLFRDLGTGRTISTMGRYMQVAGDRCWRVMAKSGFLSSVPLKTQFEEITDANIAVFWKSGSFRYGDDERDVALIRSDKGIRNGDLFGSFSDNRQKDLDRTDSNAEDGRLPMSIGAQMILDGKINQKAL